MRYLILSDIHSNWEALTAVLAEAGREGYDRIVCCGDLVGYGADPNRVTDWVRENVEPVIRGNHDKIAVGIGDLEWFNDAAQESALWTRSTLTPGNFEYLLALPQGPMVLDDLAIVHGSPADEDEYIITPTDASMVAASVPHPVTFFGHTHLQGGFQLIGRAAIAVNRVPLRADRFELELQPDVTYLLNPGSIGQPRDTDPRAAWAVFDSEARRVTYRRCGYDIEGAKAKIIQSGLPEGLAFRLDLGR
ncbi:MAG: metallophosphoesterase family protein [Acidobacteria bacterium]|nr:metallophosphoesterase family protein [Acidobacteriota bacterium]